MRCRCSPLARVETVISDMTVTTVLRAQAGVP
jgi:hypothetical protein